MVLVGYRYQWGEAQVLELVYASEYVFQLASHRSHEKNRSIMIYTRTTSLAELPTKVCYVPMPPYVPSENLVLLYAIITS